MADRVRKIMRATFNGHPLMKALDSFEEPKISHETEASHGGRFVPKTLHVAMEALSAKFELVGVSRKVLDAYGIAGDDVALFDVLCSEEDDDGSAVRVQYQIGGRIKSVEAKANKMKEKQGYTVEVDVDSYTLTEGGAVVYDIDVETQKINLGKGDLMASHRANVGLS